MMKIKIRKEINNLNRKWQNSHKIQYLNQLRKINFRIVVKIPKIE